MAEMPADSVLNVILGTISGAVTQWGFWGTCLVALMLFACVLLKDDSGAGGRRKRRRLNWYRAVTAHP